MKSLFFLVLISLQSFLLHAQEPVFKANTDLNSDNIIDKITLTGDDTDYTLSVNGQSISGNFEVENMVGFYIVDINKNDSFKEIAVHATGPSDDDIYNLYFYDGKQIRFMNSLFNILTYNNNGIVYADSWQGFWMKRDKYQLQKSNHKLKLIPQFAYYVGIKDIKVQEYFAVYSDRALTKKTAVLSLNSKIEILICDSKNANDYEKALFLIKSKSGLTGWVDSYTLRQHCSGFNYAD